MIFAVVTFVLGYFAGKKWPNLAKDIVAKFKPKA